MTRGSGGPKRPRRGLSADDRALWETVRRGARPLHGETTRLRGSTTLGASPTPEPAAPAESPAPPPRPPEPPKPHPKPPRPGPGREPAPVGRAVPGLDRRTAERLRRGDRAPDARIDLHGLTAARAHAALDGFLDRAVARRQRFLLVITGKGGGGGRGDRGSASGTGLLRDAVPGWLRAGRHGHRILALFEAHPRHGGAGALYVYLRKPG